jgi:hypothetical protein
LVLSCWRIVYDADAPADHFCIRSTASGGNMAEP